MVKNSLTILNLLLITGAVYLGVETFYKYGVNAFTPEMINPQTRKPAADIKNGVSHPLPYYQAIAKRDLFKTGGKKPEPKKTEVKVEELEQTQLKLKLWGTVIGASDNIYAVIEDGKTREQNLYQVGDTIQKALVKEVFREKVILSVKGKDEILEIEDMVGGKKTAPKLAKRTVERQPEDPPESENVSIERERVDDAIKNVNQLMKQIRIRPHFTNGQPDGIKISGIRPGSIFTEIGFKSGDIITGVDGEPIESVDDALKFYESIKSADNVNLQIKRNGVEQTIDYNVE